MAQFLIEIAGFSGEITSLFESTRDYCRNYLTEDEPDFLVTVSRDDLVFEQEALRQEALEMGTAAAEELVRAVEEGKAYIPRSICVPGQVLAGDTVKDLNQ